MPIEIEGHGWELQVKRDRLDRQLEADRRRSAAASYSRRCRPRSRYPSIECPPRAARCSVAMKPPTLRTACCIRRTMQAQDVGRMGRNQAGRRGD